jgi:hypothetical protein
MDERKNSSGDFMKPLLAGQGDLTGPAGRREHHVPRCLDLQLGDCARNDENGRARSPGARCHISGYLGYRLRNPHFPDHPLTLRMLLTPTSSLRDEGGFKWEPNVDLGDVPLPGRGLLRS